MKVSIVEYELDTGVVLSIFRDGLTIDINGQLKHFALLSFRQVYLFITGDAVEVRISSPGENDQLVFRQRIKPGQKERLTILNKCIADFNARVKQLDKNLENKLIQLLGSRLIAYDADRVQNLGRAVLHDHDHVSDQGHLAIYEHQLIAFLSYLNNSKIFTPEPKYYGLEYERGMAWDQHTPFPGTLLIDHNIAFSVYPDVMDEIRAFYEAHNIRYHLQGLQRGKGTIVDVDLMNDEEFKSCIISMFFKMGYKASSARMGGESGMNLIAYKDGNSIGIQAKCNIANVSDAEIQLLIDGVAHCQLGQGMFITNMYFTEAAIKLAESCGIVLWNRDVLRDKIYELGT